MRSYLSLLMTELLVAGMVISPASAVAQTTTPGTTTPIRHVVVIFQENVSFDHYFGTYPVAANPAGEPVFKALPGTPAVNGLSGGLQTNNPNAGNPNNGAGAINPFRLDRSQAATADQNHNYGPEQAALHGGLVDLYPASVGVAGAAAGNQLPTPLTTTGVNMGYYDGNTVTAFWNYAQKYAMNDNSFGTVFGPSTPGAINLVAGQTDGVINNTNGTGAVTADGAGGLADIGDADPTGDVCSTATGELFQMSGANIGNMLNTAGVTWGFYTTGFDLGVVNANGTTGCKRSTTSTITNTNKADYIPHHEPFQYYKSTANPTHARPTSV
jgi:phospholipase C